MVGAAHKVRVLGDMVAQNGRPAPARLPSEVVRAA